MAKIASPVRKTASKKTTTDIIPAQNRPLTGKEQLEVEKLAYQFFVERGYEHGHDSEDWLRAEEIIRSRSRS